MLIEAALDDREAFETVPVGGEEVRVLAWPVDATGPVVGVIVVGQSLRFLEVTREGVQWLITIAAGVATIAALAGGLVADGARAPTDLGRDAGGPLDRRRPASSSSAWSGCRPTTRSATWW